MTTIAEAFALALRCHQTGDWQRAEQAYRQIVETDPQHVDALCNLGAVLAQQGRLKEAEAAYRAALRVRPDYWPAHFNLGNTYRRAAQPQAAVASYQAALTANPNHAAIEHNLGLALRDLGRLDEAIRSFQRAAELQPDLADAHNHRGGLLQLLGRLDEAAAAFREVVRLRPGEPRGYNNLGLVLAAQGKLDEAVAAIRNAIALAPEYAEAHNSLGIALGEQGKVDEAAASYREAIRQKPRFAAALNNLAQTYLFEGRLDEAINYFRQSLTAEPRQPHVHSNLLLALNYHPDYEPAVVLAEHRRWAAMHADPPLPAPRPADPNPDRQLRIGYVSADFRAHTMMKLIEPMLSAHDHRSFHITCYANVPRPDAVTERLQSDADAWRSVAHVPDAALVELISRDAIDILVDLSGHTAGNRLLMFGRRPAPVQITMAGYPNTTGLDTMDFRITDPHADPLGTTEAFHTEKLYRLPETAICYRPSAAPDVGPLRADFAGPIAFGSFNNAAKVTPQVAALWARVLAAVPDAQLVLLKGRGEEAGRLLLQAFADHGIARERVTLVPRVPAEEYMALYHRVDLCLDPFPYNGSVTTCDALWMGVPVITLAGRVAAARASLSVLTNLGMPELIAQTPDEYVALAARWAGARAKLRRLRSELRARMQASPLTDAARYTRNLEQAYRTMWRQVCAEHRP